MARYRAFISYSHSDSRFAARLHRDLENFRVHREAGARMGLDGNRIGKIFRDESDLGAASELTSALTDALRDSESLIVICSPSATTSQWVRQEIREFRRLHGASARVLAIISPTAGDAPAEQLFPALIGETPPLAADARKHADGRRLALLKIVAGLLHIGLDDLVRRDTRRRHQRLLAGTVFSASTAASMALLAIFALTAREDAQRRLSQSEDLIGFMLGDLRSQLAPLGQVRVLESVGDKALNYFESLADADLTDAALLRKSRALYQIGDVYFELGQFRAAQRSFALSLEQARTLAAAQPADNERLYELAQAEFWVGYAAWSAGDLALAERHLLAYERAASTLHERDASNDDWAMETYYASNNLGSLAVRRSRFEIAQEHFIDAIARIDRLIERDDTPDRLFERSTVLSWLGSTYVHRGDLDAARDAFSRALDRPSDPANALYEEERAYELGFLADVELELGNTLDARRYLNEALAIAVRLSESDPDSMDLQYARAAHGLRAGRINLYAGENVDYPALRSAAQRLLEADAPPPAWRMLALSIADLGLLLEIPESRDWALQLLDSEAFVDASRGGLERQYFELAVRLAQQDPSEATRVREYLPQVLSAYEQSNDFELVRPLLRAFEMLGDPRGYERMRDVLLRAGSRHPEFVANVSTSFE